MIGSNIQPLKKKNFESDYFSQNLKNYVYNLMIIYVIYQICYINNFIWMPTNLIPVYYVFTLIMLQMFMRPNYSFLSRHEYFRRNTDDNIIEWATPKIETKNYVIFDNNDIISNIGYWLNICLCSIFGYMVTYLSSCDDRSTNLSFLMAFVMPCFVFSVPIYINSTLGFIISIVIFLCDCLILISSSNKNNFPFAIYVWYSFITIICTKFYYTILGDEMMMRFKKDDVDPTLYQVKFTIIFIQSLVRCFSLLFAFEHFIKGGIINYINFILISNVAMDLLILMMKIIDHKIERRYKKDITR